MQPKRVLRVVEMMMMIRIREISILVVEIGGGLLLHFVLLEHQKVSICVIEVRLPRWTVIYRYEALPGTWY